MHTPAPSLAVLVMSLVGAIAGCAGQLDSAPTSSAASPIASTSRPASASAMTAPSIAIPSGSAAVTPAPTRELPTRIVVPKLGIDLPVVSGDLSVPGNPPDYPLCDVAQFLTIYPDPSRLGATTWIYGHARPGMFLPLLEASTSRNGARLVGMTVDVYSDAARRYTYRVTTVLRHATDRSAATRVPAGERRLILQTSEGPSGTVPKLQVVAEFVSMVTAPTSEAIPKASPIGCYLGA